MILADLGESKLVAELTRGLPLGPDVRVGPGDDCAVIGRPREKLWRLLKTDAVVEGYHFLASDPMRAVGWKALCRNISDIAAMGGVPREALVTLAVAPDVHVASIKDLYAGIKRAAKTFDVSIVGGETSASPGPLFVSIALTGEVERERCTLRSTGQPGDAIYVTGTLGGSYPKKHLTFIPRLDEARWLTKHFRLHSMMDISDGLGADLPRLAMASDCGFDVNVESLPVTPGCTIQQAMNDGEDFELLFTLAPSDTKELEKTWPKTFPPIRKIGVLTEEKVFKPSSYHGFEHLRDPGK